MTDFTTVQLEKDPRGFATLWLNRPEKNNAFNAEMIRELILQWKLGHVNTGYFARKFGVQIRDRFDEAWVFNPGQQPGPVPTHVLVDLEAGEATWWSASDRASVTL